MSIISKFDLSDKGNYNKIMIEGKIIGKILITFGVLLIISGLFFYEGVKFPFGKLPGDIIIKKENFVFYFPITTGILISIILTLIFSIIWRK